jgi:hypothetical protein
MRTSAHVLVLALSLLVVVFIARLVALRQLRSKYALLWLVSAVLLLPLAAVPSLLDDLASWLGFKYAPDLLFFAATGFLFAVVMHFSWELSRLETRVRLLAEELALERARRHGTPTQGSGR